MAEIIITVLMLLKKKRKSILEGCKWIKQIAILELKLTIVVQCDKV